LGNLLTLFATIVGHLDTTRIIVRSQEYVAYEERNLMWWKTTQLGRRGTSVPNTLKCSSRARVLPDGNSYGGWEINH
jgi:hypothetical protein